MTSPVQKASIQQNLPSQEALLVDYLHRLEKHRSGRRAVHIHLSNLQPHNRREHHIRIAANTFDNLVKMLKGQLFVLANTDLMLVFKEAAFDEVQAAIVKLRFLFSDDPLLAEEMEAVRGAFATWYDLARDYDHVLQLAQRLATEAHDRRIMGEAAVKAKGAGKAKRGMGGEALSPATLGRMEETLGTSDLANLVRRQAVCAVVGKAPPQPVFYEVFISITDLRDTIAPRTNLNSSPWLFQHLTETLDRRVLSMLNRRDDRTLAGDISLNLNVATILSPEFLVFDDNVDSGSRGTIVLELNKIDIFADLGAYLFARDFAQERGYRICIDQLSYQILPFVERDRLGADYVKVVWDPDMIHDTLPDGSSIGEAVKRIGAKRTILCRCDTIEAIDFGQAVGITLFQGRYIEGMLAIEQRRRLR